MTDNAAVDGILLNKHDAQLKVPDDVLSNPALLFLYYRIEQILGIKAESENLKNLNEYMEKTCGASFLEDPASYEYLLTSREKIHEISKFLTVNETYFFREGSHFELLANLLPEFSKLKRPIKICSAASSIGCEAYSIAMLLDYYICNGIELDYNIDAFDVNNDSIETAINARYTANSLRNDGKTWSYILDNYLIQDKNEYIISDKIKRKVRFFPHNIMRGLDKQYDIIFFRNALIYFSTKHRHIILNNLAESLYPGGLLFLGISEISSIQHPLFASRYTSDVFYFQKITNPNELNAKNIYHSIKPKLNTAQPKLINNKYPSKNKSIAIFCNDIGDILKTEEGKQNAEFVLDMINKNEQDNLFGSQMAAAVIYYLQSQELEQADFILSYLEKYNTDSCTKFLRGEYYYLLDNYKDAENYYQEACYKDQEFWPAFYRLALLSSDGNKTRYEYKIKKTIESIELNKNSRNDNIGNTQQNNYECFMGGFSCDYFLKILEKKLT